MCVSLCVYLHVCVFVCVFVPVCLCVCVFVCVCPFVCCGAPCSVCSGVLACVAVRCRVLQCILQCVAVCVAVCCSVCCAVLWCVVVCVAMCCHLLHSVVFFFGMESCLFVYGLATISRLLKIIGLFCRTKSLLQGSFAKDSVRSIEVWSQRCVGWIRLVGSLKLQVSFAEQSLFYRAILQKRHIISRSLLIVATPYNKSCNTCCNTFIQHTRCNTHCNAHCNMRTFFYLHTKRVCWIKVCAATSTATHAAVLSFTCTQRGMRTFFYCSWKMEFHFQREMI